MMLAWMTKSDILMRSLSSGCLAGTCPNGGCPWRQAGRLQVVVEAIRLLLRRR